MFFKSKKTSAARGNVVRRPSAEPSYIGRNTTIEGSVSCEDELHIDGTVTGRVRARLCVIDKNGIIQGDVSGEVVHVRGRVIGPIQGASVFIHAGAHVEGDVFNDTISIENGAYVFGSIRHNGPPPAARQTQIASQPTLETAAKLQQNNPLRIVSSKK